MKRVSKVLAAVSVALLSAGAHAEVIKYRFDAKVTAVTEYDPATDAYTDVRTSAFAGTPVAVGDRISGFFQYDTSVGLADSQPVQTPGSIARAYSSSITDLISYVDQDTALAFKSMPGLNWLGMSLVQDSVAVPGAFTPDSFFMSLAAIDDMFIHGATITLGDSSGTAFGTADMPATLDPGAFQFASLKSGFLRRSDQGLMDFSADMTSLQRADVPEPGSALLFSIAGAALLRARRKRA